MSDSELEGNPDSQSSARFLHTPRPSVSSSIYYSRTRFNTDNETLSSVPPSSPRHSPQFTLPVYNTPPQQQQQQHPSPQLTHPVPYRIESPRHPASGLMTNPFRDREMSVYSQQSAYQPARLIAPDEDDERVTFSSYQHPYDIPPPTTAHLSSHVDPQRNYPAGPRKESQASSPLTSGPYPRKSSLRRSVSFVEAPDIREFESDSPANAPKTPYPDNLDPRFSISSEATRVEGVHNSPAVPPSEMDSDEEKYLQRAIKRRGIPTNLLQLQSLQGDEHDFEDDDDDQSIKSNIKNPKFNLNPYGYTRATSTMLRRQSSDLSADSQVLDEDDPRVTGVEAEFLEDKQDVEKNVLKMMDYRARRKHQQRVRIEFNVSSMIHRQDFLIKLARSLMAFGSPSHRIESQLVAAARILEVEAEFIHLPGVTICSFGDQELGCSDTHFIRCGGRLVLGSLHRVHIIYRSVVHDEVSAKTATEQLEDLLKAPPLYPPYFRFMLAFSMSALICPLAFGGSFLDMWIAGAGGLVLATLQISVASKGSSTYANVFEITVAILMSFVARGLSSIRSHIFCYTAISSSAIIGILPGYLILLSSLELASKNIVCGSVKMVYALIYTLFLGFGLQIGSDFYLLFDRTTRARLNALEKSLANTVSLSGTWLSDNDTDANATGIPAIGTWTFTHSLKPEKHNIVDGCFRPEGSPWYLQVFPFWTAFFIVPIFSLLSSLANLQPIRSKELLVMVVISCASYASNKVANHYIFNRSDVVSAIGAFTIGLLGNIYSRKMGGTAFTSMVTGVLFLVPSGLSQSGGITAHGNGIDIGGAMISVTIGITVGLFMSQALVYMFGSRKNAAAFSF